MFEGILSDLLNRLLGTYIENLDCSKLKVSIWGGDVTLKNLIVKQSALDELGLPVRSMYGHLKYLCLKIPWSKIYTDRWEVIIDGLTLVVVPSSSAHYDPHKEQQIQLEAKLATLARIEEAKRRNKLKSSGIESKSHDGYLEKLIAIVVRNIQIKITNIHIRYEDSLTCSEKPFAAGFTMQNLSLQSTDKSWNIGLDTSKLIYKLMTLEGFLVYWSPNSKILSQHENVEEVKNILFNLISDQDMDNALKPVLGPLNLTAKLQLNPRPESDEDPFSVPKTSLTVVLKKLTIGLSRYQYEGMMNLWDSLESMRRSSAYRKYRPNVDSIIGHGKLWWKYAYNCKLEDIKRIRRNWSWNHMKMHRKRCQRYKEIYKLKINGSKLNREQKEELDKIEEILDVFNITLVRKQAEMELEREGFTNAEVERNRGWFASWLSWSSQEKSNLEDSSTSLVKKFEAEMTPEEKSKFYEAIGYYEDVPNDMPVDYVDFRLSFRLDELLFQVVDEMLEGRTVIVASTRQVFCDISNRSAASAIKIESSMHSFDVKGFFEEYADQPLLVESLHVTDEVPLLDVLFETNPLNEECHTRIYVHAQPLNIAYQSSTIAQITDIFVSPKNISLQQLQSAALTRLEVVKEKSVAGLQAAIDNHNVLDLNINIKSSKIILPEFGFFKPNSCVIVVNLGSVLIASKCRGNNEDLIPFAKTEQQKEVTLNRMRISSYDRFIIHLNDVQAIVADKDDDWCSALTSEVTALHLLQPLSLNVDVYKCLISGDPSLPKLKIDVKLSEIYITIIDKKLIKAVIIINNCFNQNATSLINKRNDSTVKLEIDQNQNVIGDELALIRLENKEALFENRERTTQFIELVFNFTIAEMTLELQRYNGVEKSSAPLLKLAASKMALNLVKRTFDLNVDIFLLNLSAYHLEWGYHDILRTCLESDLPNQKLLNIRILQVNPKSPDIQLIHNYVIQQVDIEMSKLTVRLEQSALLSIFAFTNNVQENLRNQLPQNRCEGAAEVASQKRKSKIVDEQNAQNNKKSSVLHKPNLKQNFGIKVDAVEVFISKGKLDLFTFCIKGLTLELVMMKQKMEITSCLERFSFVNSTPDALHNKIITMEEGNAWNAHIKIFEEGSNDIDFFDVNKFDFIIKVEVGTPRIIFLNKTFTDILSWINNFQSAKEAILNASQAAAKAAKQNIRETFSHQSKIKLALLLKAPVIFIPQSSTSKQGVLLDLGKIIIGNYCELGRMRNELGYPSVLDKIDVEVQNVKLSRKESVLESQEILLLQPFSVKVKVIRNLSYSWFKDLPEIGISGSLTSIQMIISEDDMSSLLAIREGNLEETSDYVTTMKTQISESQVQSSASDNEKALADHGNIYKKLSLDFTIEDASLTLFTSESGVTFERLSAHQQEFAKISLRDFTIKLNLFSDCSIATNLLLSDCILKDIRKDGIKKITTMVEKKTHVNETGLRNPMIDITFHQGKLKNIFIDMKISQIMIILHLPFLLRMQKFFIVESFKDMSNEGTSIGNTNTNVQNPQYRNRSFNKEIKPEKLRKEEHDTEGASSGYDSVIAIHLKLEEPDIVFVDDLANIDSSCIFLHGEIQSAIKISFEQRNITAAVKNLQMYTSVFNPSNRNNMLSQILMKSDISFLSSATSTHADNIQLKLGTLSFRLAPDTVELMMRILSCLSIKEETSSGIPSAELKDWINLWDPKAIDFSSLPNLNIDAAEEALFDFSPSTGQTILNATELSASSGKETLIVEMECLLLTLESNNGTLSTPFLKTQIDCCFTAEGFYSSQLTFDGQISIEMAYYNHRQAIWEPLLEPVEKISHKTSKMEHQPWKINFEGHMTLDARDIQKRRISPMLLSPSTDSLEMVEIDHPPPLTKLYISAKDPLEFTITKTFLEIMPFLSESFMAAYKGNLVVRKLSTAPYKLINKTGLSVSIKLRESGLQILRQMDSNIETVLVETDGEADLFESSSIEFSHRRHSSLVAQCQIASEKLITIQIVEADVQCCIPVTKSDKRYFPITPIGDVKEKFGLVASVVVEEGCKIITLSGCVKVTNQLDTPVDIYFMTESGNEVEHVAELNPSEQSLLPLHAVYTSSSEIFFAIKGYSVCINPLVWKCLQNYPNLVQQLNCQPNVTENDLKLPFFFCASCNVEQIFWKNTSRRTVNSVMVTVNLKPCIIFSNLLPVALHFYPPSEIVQKILLPGASLNINHAQLGSMYLEIEIFDYRGSDWKCGKSIELNPSEFNVWSFKKIGETDEMMLDLGLRITTVNGVYHFYLYCPFWMINKTGFNLAYKADSLSTLFEHEKNFKHVLLFSFGSKAFFGKKKASLRLQDSEWSQKFSLDAVGSAAAVSCRMPDNSKIIFQISINIQLSSSGLTKIVTFTPFYKALNQCPYDLQFCLEEDLVNIWHSLPAGECAALWPSETIKALKVRVKGALEKTEAIHFDTSHSTLFKLKNKFGGVFVDVSETEGSVLMSFDKCIIYASSALILNHLRTSSLTFWQEGQEDKKIELGPQQMIYFTWDSAGSRRLLLFSCLGLLPVTIALNEDSNGSIDKGMAGWATWMAGAQRYLIVSEDQTMLESPSSYNVLEQVRQETEVSFSSIGLSIVNDMVSQEIMYLSFTSSGIVWEHRKESGKKYRPFTEEQTILLEKAYLMYSAELKAFKENIKAHFLLKPQLEVDFSLMKTFKPFNRPIRRVFQPGVWIKLQIMSNERNFHMKINKLQLDNQVRSDVMFPVVLSRVPPSKGVMVETVPKPFFEMSIIMSLESPVYSRFKYFSVLIQEFHLKVELPFIYLLMQTLSKKETMEVIYTPDEYEKDSAIIDQNILSIAISEKHPSRRDFYHYLHLSPIKMHLSFSLTGISDSESDVPIGGQVIHLFLQSVGVTLTEIQDVIFRLGFFERQNCWLNKESFQSEVISHYTNQIIKQLYVLVLGLDVIGNPFGLVLGVTKGFGDLFYEPIQGAVEGPGEFAEGIFYGMRSFMGKTVGGAAGAFSRITGTIGKGMASLTLDEEYQRRRREEMHKKPADGFESIARSGKSVFTGVVDGVTGVFTKPISGAKEEGVEGFFKGVGKGVIGLVTRPASGMIDFASGSFDAIMRATDSTEDGLPIRPSRYIKLDGIIRPFQLRQATGSKLLKELQKGQFSETDVYSTHSLLKDGKSIILASDKRIFLLCRNDLLGQWKIEWLHCYHEFAEPPILSSSGIKISVKETKKMFGVFNSGGNVKEISPQNPSDIMTLFEEISESYVKFLDNNH